MVNGRQYLSLCITLALSQKIRSKLLSLLLIFISSIGHQKRKLSFLLN